jgi:tripeptidyl-peptidase I
VYVPTCLLEKALIADTRTDMLCTQAYPDVSAQSLRFLVYYQGNTALISGTSAAAPTFAAVVALLNDAMLSAGKPPLGFLNPLLYGAGAAGLNDITTGNNIGCGTRGFNVRFVFPSFLYI